MAKPLVIVESPAKAHTIEGFLGRGQFTVQASNGHIRDLPRSSKEVPKGVTDPDVRRLAIDVNNHFEPDLGRARPEEGRRQGAEGRAEGRERASTSRRTRTARARRSRGTCSRC